MEFSVEKLLVLLLIIILVFGTGKLPKVGEDLGRAVRSFKKAMRDGEHGPAAGGQSDEAKSKSDTDSTPH